MNLNLDRITLICSSCSQELGTDSLNYEDPPDDSGWPFYVTKEELEEAGGWIECEYCGAKCVEVKEETL